MATDVAPQGVNGNYGSHNGYHSNEPYNGTTYSATSQPFTPAPPTSSTSAASTSQSPEIGKDEVGWFFVEQYYTTLSREPEKLHLYYNKRSQYVSGNETDKVPVCVGQRAIHERIKELDFKNCKVRITNVDSQASDVNIVIQVIGEISNKSQPHRKFSQTFILATQTNGYFVLNDIFRYLIEEEDEEVADAAETAALANPASEDSAVENGVTDSSISNVDIEPRAAATSSEPDAVESDAKTVDDDVEDTETKAEPAVEESAAPKVNGTSEKHAEEDVATDAAAPATTADAEESTTANASVTETAAPEKSAAPEPARAASPPQKAQAAAAAPVKPAVPKTWASLAASANRSAPASTPAAQSQPRPTPAAKQPSTSTSVAAASPATAASPAPASNAATSAPAAPAAQPDDSIATKSTDEWTAVSSTHNRQQSRAQVNGHQQQQHREPDNTPNSRGYIKNVTETIQHADLEAAMSKFGEFVQFDISRQRNCAFVDYKTPEAYQAAVAANPHVVNGEKLWMEQRRIREPGTPGYNPRGAFNHMRGGRGSFRGGERGGFAPRGRGAPGAPRGRGAPQAA
nr:hypothetical protein B0A51_11419 [Rachicladosporium sp. CCFEE 5018]OQO24253.1 hypothetical protein B0A51_08698 [Rachicladosporium sp. CCFEE 5018]